MLRFVFRILMVFVLFAAFVVVAAKFPVQTVRAGTKVVEVSVVVAGGIYNFAEATIQLACQKTAETTKAVKAEVAKKEVARSEVEVQH